jgi:hypothetical protein
MKRAVMILAVLAAIVAAFFLGRFSVEAPGGRAFTRTAVPEAGIEDSAADAQATRAGPADQPAAPRGARAPAPSVAPASQANGPASTGGGPKPLSPEGEKLVSDLADRLLGRGEPAGEQYELGRKEPQDDRARMLEEMIAMSLRRHGSAYTALELGPPRCTRTVCTLMAVGAEHTQDPRSDWQRLFFRMVAEPWFRENFADQSTVVADGGGRTLYLTTLVRKD